MVYKSSLSYSLATVVYGLGVSSSLKDEQNTRDVSSCAQMHKISTRLYISITINKYFYF